MTACILIVDDDRSTCQASAEASHVGGYSVVAAVLKLDLLLLDVIVPGRDGAEFVRRFSE